MTLHRHGDCCIFNITKMKNSITKIVVLTLSSIAVVGGLWASGPSAADVGDSDSFGHPALYMGAKSGFITLSPSCTPAPTPVPPATANDDQCFNLPVAPASASYSANDILRINLPAKATRTIIYPALNFFMNYQLQNLTGAPQNGRFFWTASVDIESTVLTDPTIIDPATGLPAGGKLVGQFSYAYGDDRTMQNGDRQRLRETLVRVGNAGINKAQLIGQGLDPTVVDNLFKNPMTLRMNVTLTAQLVTDASLTCNMRLFGD
jgi:hypothetical protein